MSGRFPFDSTNGQNPGRLTNAQMRAALGMGAGVDDLTALYLEQQRAQQEAQRDFQYRQALYQEHLEQQLQELQQLQLRARIAQLDDYPELQQHYRNLLNTDHLQRRTEEQALLRQQVEQQADAQRAFQQQSSQQVVEAAFAAAAAAQQQEHATQAQQVAAAAAAQQQQLSVAAAQQHYQDELRRQQTAAALRLHGIPFGSLAAAAAPPAERLQQVTSPTASSTLAEAIAALQRASSTDEGDLLNRKRAASILSQETDPRDAIWHETKMARSNQILESVQLRQAGITHTASQDYGGDEMVEVVDPPPGYLPPTNPAVAALQQIAAAADMVVPQNISYGSVEDLLNAAEKQEKVFEGAEIMSSLAAVRWPDSDDEEKVEKRKPTNLGGLPVPETAAESLITNKLSSFVPDLPVEPLFDESEEGDEREKTAEAEIPSGETTSSSQTEEGELPEESEKQTNETASVSNILEYPYPVDTWWPSTSGRRRERKQAGETSDEDNFAEEGDIGCTVFRANASKIRDRLSKMPEPGVLEKLPHCGIHRLKKKGSTVAELVYCFQVTECYPNDLMVNCTRCGTWRHAGCGGHYKPISTRDHTKEPFIAVCDLCHEEEAFLKDNARGQKRLERQRMEQLRRSFATSAVMRCMSFAKHGGTYKWPLGSVSATHTGGHIRSVQARHDKTEKQWTDMAARLGRGYGYRAKERQRVRTKELERLLVSIEDAEGQTDRHNMLLFLTRDTARDVPVGYETEHRNIFDPADDVLDGFDGSTIAQVSSSDEPSSDEEKTAGTPLKGAPGQDGGTCLRVGCQRKHRFDSRFCSDACGVWMLEKDLLRSFHDSSDLHPSVLRSHY